MVPVGSRKTLVYVRRCVIIAQKAEKMADCNGLTVRVEVPIMMSMMDGVASAEGDGSVQWLSSTSYK